MSPHETVDNILAEHRQAVGRLGVTTFSHLVDYVYRLQQEWYSAIRDTSAVMEGVAECELTALCKSHGVYISWGRVYNAHGEQVKDGPVAEALERYTRLALDAAHRVGERLNVVFGDLRTGEQFKDPRDPGRVFTKTNNDGFGAIGHHIYPFLPETEVIRVS